MFGTNYLITDEDEDLEEEARLLGELRHCLDRLQGCETYILERGGGGGSSLDDELRGWKDKARDIRRELISMWNAEGLA